MGVSQILFSSTYHRCKNIQNALLSGLFPTLYEKSSDLSTVNDFVPSFIKRLKDEFEDVDPTRLWLSEIYSLGWDTLGTKYPLKLFEPFATEIPGPWYEVPDWLVPFISSSNEYPDNIMPICSGSYLVRPVDWQRYADQTAPAKT